MSALLERFHTHAMQQPEVIALADRTSKISYRQLLLLVTQRAAILSCTGAKTMGLWQDNSVNWVINQLAALQARITLVPIPTFFSEAQAGHLLAELEPDILLTDSGNTYDLETAGYRSESQRLGLYRRRIPGKTDMPDCALLTFTSGSTGTPKGVRIGAELIDQSCEALFQATASLDISQHHCLLPLSVMLENIAGALLPLYAGKTAVILPPGETGMQGSSITDPQQLNRFLHQQRPESLILVPQLLKLLLMLNSQQALPDSLRFVAVGGGKVSPALLSAAAEAGIPVFEGYGLSECGSVVSLNLPGQSRSGSVGKVLPHHQVRISDGGEIHIRGANMQGYLPYGPESTDEIATGDLGFIDDGFLFITGRKKSLQINSYGRNFSPEWIEADINSLPGVANSLICGDARPYITAIIQLLPGYSAPRVQHSIDQLNQRLPDYARIRQWLPVQQWPAELITDNGRPKRHLTEQHFRSQIDAFYLQDHAAELIREA